MSTSKANMNPSSPKEDKKPTKSKTMTGKKGSKVPIPESVQEQNGSIELIYRQADPEVMESDRTSRIASTCNHLNADDPQIKDLIHGQAWANDDQTSSTQSTRALLDPKIGKTDIMQELDSDGDDIL